MKTNCPHCRKEYNFDDAKVPRPVVPIQCSGCKKVFYYHRALGSFPDKNPPPGVTVKPTQAETAKPPPGKKETVKTATPQEDLDALVQSLRAEKERLVKEEVSPGGSAPSPTDFSPAEGEEIPAPAPAAKRQPASAKSAAPRKSVPSGPIEFGAEELGADIDTALGKIQLETKEVPRSKAEVPIAAQVAPRAWEPGPESGGQKLAETVKMKRPGAAGSFDIHTSVSRVPPVKRFPWFSLLGLVLVLGVGGAGLYYFLPREPMDLGLPPEPAPTVASDRTIKTPATPPATATTLGVSTAAVPATSAEVIARPLSDLEMARQLYRSHNPGSYRQAEIFFDNILAKNADDPQALAGLSLVYSSRSQMDENDALLQRAFELAQKGLAKSDKEAEVHLALGQALVYAGKYEEGLREAMKVRELAGKDNAQAEYLLALVARDGRHESDKAAGYLRLAQKLDGDDPRIAAELLKMQIQEKRKIDALLAAERCRNHFRRSPQCQLTAARAFEVFDKPSEAAEAYREASELLSDQLSPLLGQARALLLTEEYGKAELALRGAATRKGTARQKAEVHYLLGKAWLGLKREEPALEEFEKALLEDETYISPHNYLGEYYFKKEQYTKAASHLEKSLAAKPDSTLVRRNLAIVYYKAGEHRRALGEFQKVVQDKQEKPLPSTYYYLGLIYEKLGDKAKALRMHRAALKLDPGYKNSRVRLQKLGG